MKTDTEKFLDAIQGMDAEGMDALTKLAEIFAFGDDQTKAEMREALRQPLTSRKEHLDLADRLYNLYKARQTA